MGDVTADEALKRSATIIWNFVSIHPLVVAGSVLLVIAVILALLDKIAAGSLVAGLFVVVTLFQFLPQMEHFKAK